MNDIKICVYAICKNEEKFVDRWLNSVNVPGVDYIRILDTGSDDGTFSKLILAESKDPKINIEQFDYGYDFRFDRARNDSMKFIPLDTDICVILDFDHIPNEGWTDILREEYMKGNKIVTGYIVDHDENGKETNRWMSKNVHPNSPYFVWDRMIHEGIHFIGKEDDRPVESFRPDFIINHFPDYNKDRSLYIELLKHAVELYPTDPYYNIYYGVELDRRYDKNDAFEAFKNGLERCEFDEESEDLRYQMLINAASTCSSPALALNYLEDAIDMGIETRRVYYDCAEIYAKMDDIDEEIKCLLKALTIDNNTNDWRDDFELYNGKIEDQLALIYYYNKKDYLKAIQYGSIALQMQSDNERFKSNLDWYFKAYKGEL
jgi:hypothetical protein